MSVAAKVSRTYVFAENLGDWTWPGRSGAGEVLPPAWVPTLPPRREALSGETAASQTAPSQARRLLIGLLLAALAAVCVALAQSGQLTIGGLLGKRVAISEQPSPGAVSAAAVDAQSLPALSVVSQDGAGSFIDTASFVSPSLHGAHGTFLAYLPAGYVSSTARYPVLYLLTGTDQSNTAFLEIGIQRELDRLIAAHEIPPVIAVMIQGGPGTNNWRNLGGLRYENYVLETQELVDRMLPTIPARNARAIVGDSMGGYGAMNAALSNPYRFGVVESWIGFFNGLEGQLAADRPIFRRLGMQAFVYGGAEDKIADPSEDRPFASALHAAGADAHGAVYPGEHNLQTLEAHLGSMLRFAGRALDHEASAQQIG
jgi:hypothetical protein